MRTRQVWIPRLMFVVVALVLIAGGPSLLSDFRLNLLAKYLCFAIVAVGIDLCWGYGGMLTMGQGVFFGLGGYAMGMYLKLAEAGPGKVPDFMSWSGVETLPWFWKPFANAWFALPAAILVPVLAAVVIGVLVFRQRVRGAYFAILSQALAAAFVILLVGQQGYTGGTNGLTNVTHVFGFDLTNPLNKVGLYMVVVVALGAAYLFARQLVRSRFGRLLIAVRDAEVRVRFLGYDPALIKVVAYSVAAGMAGLAGALFVPVVGIISPAELGVIPSLELVVMVAVGGRGTLAGAVLGALVVNYARTQVSEALPELWTFIQGGLLIAVITVARGGLMGLVARAWKRLRHRASPLGSIWPEAA